MFMLVREGESGVALQILLLLNFINIAEVFLLHRRTPKFRCSYSIILSYLMVRKMQGHLDV